jgi:hypothetical protein
MADPTVLAMRQDTPEYRRYAAACAKSTSANRRLDAARTAATIADAEYLKARMVWLASIPPGCGVEAARSLHWRSFVLSPSGDLEIVPLLAVGDISTEEIALELAQLARLVGRRVGMEVSRHWMEAMPLDDSEAAARDAVKRWRGLCNG